MARTEESDQGGGNKVDKKVKDADQAIDALKYIPNLIEKKIPLKDQVEHLKEENENLRLTIKNDDEVVNNLLKRIQQYKDREQKLIDWLDNMIQEKTNEFGDRGWQVTIDIRALS